MAKKALVFIKEYQGNSVGKVMRVGEASEIDSWQHWLLSEYLVKVDVQEGLDEAHLQGVLIPAAPQQWSNGVNTVFDQGDVPLVDGVPDPAYAYSPAVPEHWEVQENAVTKTAADKALQIGAAYAAMETEVIDEMKKVFLTTNQNSATAFYETWKLMAEKPQLFTPKNLKVKHDDLTGFDVGDVLDTDQKVQDHANALIAKVEAYGVWRVERIQQFEEAKAAIESA